MSPALRLISLVLVSGVLVYFQARSMRWWLALLITGLSIVLLLPHPWPWLPVGSAMALCAVGGLMRASLIVLRGPHGRIRSASPLENAEGEAGS